MKTVILIPCCKNKRNEKCRAKDMYLSVLFRARLSYAEQFEADIYILSAKYGLINYNDIIEPYNVSLKDFSKEERIKWSAGVVEKLKSLYSLSDTKFIVLAGNFYIEYILPHLKNYEMPLSFCGDKYIGKKLNWLKEHTEDKYLLF